MPHDSPAHGLERTIREGQAQHERNVAAAKERVALKRAARAATAPDTDLAIRALTAGERDQLLAIARTGGQSVPDCAAMLMRDGQTLAEAISDAHHRLAHDAAYAG